MDSVPTMAGSVKGDFMRLVLGLAAALGIMTGGANAAIYQIQHGSPSYVTTGQTVDVPVSFVYRYKCEDWRELQIFFYNGVALCDGSTSYSTYQTVDVTLNSTYDFLTFNGGSATTDLIGLQDFIALGNAQTGAFTWHGVTGFICFMMSAIYTCESYYGWEYGIRTANGSFVEVGGYGPQTVSQVPLPAAAWLFLAGIAGVMGARRKA